MASFNMTQGSSNYISMDTVELTGSGLCDAVIITPMVAPSRRFDLSTASSATLNTTDGSRLALPSQISIHPHVVIESPLTRF